VTDKAGRTLALYGFERTYFEKLRLAAQVIIDAGSDLDFVSDPLEAELGIFKDHVEFMLLLPEAGIDEITSRNGNGDAPHT
jgi:hypothetical protein